MDYSVLPLNINKIKKLKVGVLGVYQVSHPYGIKDTIKYFKFLILTF
jgi:hypothetical protein